MIPTILLYDADKNNFPNLALMKISGWYRAQGYHVEWWNFNKKGKVYSSQVFTYTKRDLPINVISGGSGIDLKLKLPEYIEHQCPDYSLYGINYSMGFLTRGCIRKCNFCVVPKKEGQIKKHADIEEFLLHDKAVLLDNNVLAHDHGIMQLEKISRLGIKVDFNQGLDARLIDNTTARLLSKVKWLKPIRLACDSIDMIKHVYKAVTNLRWHNTTPRRYSCYILIKDIESALERVRFLKSLDVDPFAQPFVDPFGNKNICNKEIKSFARWVNHKAEYKSRSWEDYKIAH